MADRFIVPSHESGFTELSRTRSIKGKAFRKHILNKGVLIHPNSGARINIDDDFVSKMKKNFDDGVCDIVQVPLATGKNEHSEDPNLNIGEVVDIEEEDGKIYAVLDARDEQAAAKLGKTLLGASAMIHQNYPSDKTGETVGPTLLHVCVTNRPYVTGLEDYQEIVAASADGTGEVVLLTETEKAMPTKEELLAALKEHGIDVADLQAKLTEASKNETAVADLQAKVAQAEAEKTALETKAAEGEQIAATHAAMVSKLQELGVVSLTAGAAADDTAVTEAVTEAIVSLTADNKSLLGRVGSLEKRNATIEVQQLVNDGKIEPSKLDAFVELKMSNPAMFDKLVPEKPVIKLSAEEGVTPPEEEQKQKFIDDEVARLTNSLETL